MVSFNVIFHFVIQLMRCRRNITVYNKLACGKTSFVIEFQLKSQDLLTRTHGKQGLILYVE